MKRALLDQQVPKEMLTTVEGKNPRIEDKKMDAEKVHSDPKVNASDKKAQQESTSKENDCMKITEEPKSPEINCGDKTCDLLREFSTFSLMSTSASDNLAKRRKPEQQEPPKKKARVDYPSTSYGFQKKKHIEDWAIGSVMWAEDGDQCLSIPSTEKGATASEALPDLVLDEAARKPKQQGPPKETVRFDYPSTSYAFNKKIYIEDWVIQSVMRAEDVDRSLTVSSTETSATASEVLPDAVLDEIAQGTEPQDTLGLTDAELSTLQSVFPRIAATFRGKKRKHEK